MSTPIMYILNIFLISSSVPAFVTFFLFSCLCRFRHIWQVIFLGFSKSVSNVRSKQKKEECRGRYVILTKFVLGPNKISMLARTLQGGSLIHKEVLRFQSNRSKFGRESPVPPWNPECLLS